VRLALCALRSQLLAMRIVLPVLLALLATSSALAQRPAEAAAHERVGQLLGALKDAPDAATAARLEGQIRLIWAQSGSPAARLLVHRGARELEEGQEQDALDDLDAALLLAPDLPEALLQRAQIRFHLGDYPGAVRDIQATVEREPRHFIAFQLLSHIAEAEGDYQGALVAWKKALELDPRTADAAGRLKQLEFKAFGEPT